MLAQSSSLDNDNLEIGSEGGEIEVYFDTGGGLKTLPMLPAVRAFPMALASFGDDSWERYEGFLMAPLFWMYPCIRAPWIPRQDSPLAGYGENLLRPMG